MEIIRLRHPEGACNFGLSMQLAGVVDAEEAAEDRLNDAFLEVLEAEQSQRRHEEQRGEEAEQDGEQRAQQCHGRCRCRRGRADGHGRS